MFVTWDLFLSVQSVMSLISNVRTASASPNTGTVTGWMTVVTIQMRRTVVRMGLKHYLCTKPFSLVRIDSKHFAHLQDTVKMGKWLVEMAGVSLSRRSVMAMMTVRMVQMKPCVINVSPPNITMSIFHFLSNFCSFWLENS